MNDRLMYAPGHTLALGAFTIDLRLDDVHDAGGQRVPLRRQTLAVLLQLARHAGQVVSRQALLDTVWKDLFVTDDSLVQCIVEIRRALGPAAAALKTVPRRGYVLELGPQPADGTAATHRPGSETSIALAADGPAPMPFVGRQAEMNLLMAHNGEPGLPGSVVLIAGEPGIGKSRLMEEAARVAAASSATTLTLKCHEIESGVAYGALCQLIDRLVALADNATLRALDDVSRAELAALVPALATRLAPLAPLLETDASLRRARLRAALVELCGALARRKRLIVCIDDAHWLDEASAVALFAVAKATSRSCCSIWVTLRGDEAVCNPNAARLVQALLDLPNGRRLEPSRLTPHDVASIVGQADDTDFADAATVERLMRESAGNPFYLRELMQAHRANPGTPTPAPSAAEGQPVLPTGILDAVLRRARHLPGDARRLLEAAAVLEQGAGFDVLRNVAGQAQEHPAALEALEVLLRAGWLVEHRERSRYLFAHDKLREAIHASLPDALRRNLHGRAARALLDESARGNTPLEHAVVAAHAQRGGDEALAFEHFALAGDAARRVFELRRAEAHYTQALAFATGPIHARAAGLHMALLEKRGAVRSMLGCAADAEADLRSAIERARALLKAADASGPAEDARAALMGLHLELGVMLQRHHRLEDALVSLVHALDLARAAQAEGATAAARCWLGDVEWMRERNRAARLHFEAVLGDGGAVSLPSRPKGECGSAKNEVAPVAPPGIPEGASWSAQQEGTALNPQVEAIRTKALFGLAQCAGMDARPARADSLLDQAFARASVPAERFYECAWSVLKGWVRVGGHGMNQPEAAHEFFERCLRLSRQTDLFWYAVPCNIGTGVVHAEAGRFDTAIEQFEAVLRLPADDHNDRWRLSAGVWLAACHLDHGDPAAALAAARQAQRAMAESGPFMFAGKLQPLITTALVRLGRVDDCDDPQPLVEQARRHEVGYVVVAALQARAEWLHARADRPALRECAQALQREATDRGLPRAAAAAAGWLARAQPA